jgi:AraC-like DNA-binding protein
MKAGELYDLAKQLYPSLTKRLFTQFYNMAMEDISRSIRLSVVEQAYTGTTYAALPATAVKIEDIVTDEVCYWRIVNNELKLYDTEGEEIATAPDGLIIRSWNAITNALSDVVDESGFTDASEFSLKYAAVTA